MIPALYYSGYSSYNQPRLKSEKQTNPITETASRVLKKTKKPANKKLNFLKCSDKYTLSKYQPSSRVSDKIRLLFDASDFFKTGRKGKNESTIFGISVLPEN